MRRPLLLAFGAICIFAVVAALMLKLMPPPLKDSDYMVIGSVATLVTLLALFFGLAFTAGGPSNVFFKKRRKKG
jgi:ABC-type Fe3+-siderophore transport system permease subunit